KLSALSPGEAAVLIDMVHHLAALAPSTPSALPSVPLHGQFRPGHLFLSGDKIVAIDLDAIRISDPAKDVARFIHVVKRSCAEDARDLNRAERLADEFE